MKTSLLNTFLFICWCVRGYMVYLGIGDHHPLLHGGQESDARCIGFDEGVFFREILVDIVIRSSMD
jgi:hypothetical protein